MIVKPRMFQQGGEMTAPVEDPNVAPAPELAGDPIVQLASMAAQALQNQDSNLAFLVCQALLELVQAAQGSNTLEGQPVFKKGGKISRFVKR